MSISILKLFTGKKNDDTEKSNMNRCITYLLYLQREEYFKIQYIFYLRIVFKIKKMGKRDKKNIK